MKLVIFILLALFNIFILSSAHAIGEGRNQRSDEKVPDGAKQNVNIPNVNRPDNTRQNVNIPDRGRPDGQWGGQRGGQWGGHRDGNYPSRAVDRSPSMSRAGQNLPARNWNEQRFGGRTDTRNQVQQFIRNNPSVNFPNAQTFKDQRPGNRDRDGHFNRISNNVRDDIHRRFPNRSNWFNQNFFTSHNYRPAYFDYRGNLWRGVGAVELGRWINLNSQPYYYGYDGDWGPSSYVINLAQTQVVTNQDVAVNSSNWMPLGVFSVSKNGDSIASPNMFIQLALSKNGDIAGSYYNTTTNQVYELEGGIDPQSQRAFWKIADNPESPFVETGLFNLTQNVAPIRVYFQNGEIKEYLLIRVDS